MQAHLTSLAVYPIKSCRGIALSEAMLSTTGLSDDRHWMVVRPNGRFVTQRELPRMALIHTRLDEAGVALTAPAMTELRVSRKPGGVGGAVTVWKFSGSGIDCGDEAADWLTRFLETPLRLVAFDPGVPRYCPPEWTGEVAAQAEFSDAFPLLVISTASLAELNTRLPKPLPMERFRPNLVIDGVAPYDEDRIAELRSGEVVIRLVKPSTRCAITTTDQITGQRDGEEPLATLKKFRFNRELRGVMFGQNAITALGVGQTLRAGQRFEIAWK